MKVKHLNIIFSGLLIALSTIFYFYADTFLILPGQADIGPKAFPRAICLALIILGILLIISEIKKNDNRTIPLVNIKLLIGLATAVLFLLCFKTVGFVICAVVSILVMELLLLNEPLKKAWPLVFGIAIIVPIAIQLIFGILLKVPLPAGLLSFIF